MQSGLARALERLRQPEYTGENRCIPCTSVNVVIAAIGSVAVGIVSPPIAVAAFVLSLLAIYFRGYLIPGTPSLTKRYFPDWLLAKFEKAPPGYGVDGDGLEAKQQSDHGPDPMQDRESRLDPEAVLLEADIVEPCADHDDLCLAENVETAWRERMHTVRDDDREQRLATFLETDPENVAVSSSHSGDHVRVHVDGQFMAHWESSPALVADLAALEVLGERLSDWETYPIDQRSQLANGMRAFLEFCPDCDGAISIDTDTVESCCRSYEVYAITCNDCGARLLEVDA
ncbi:hypothetical protein ACLI4Y_14050 [Natrialbaceae archaeon A-CW3]